ncbi:MAG TPA: VOC family protein [Thermomicrobiaceae bacterium]|nr:VOC family protein [Thermomicrobiaceae bacterium]
MEAVGRDIAPFLTFMGRAEEAMRFYVALFERSEVLSITRYGPDVPGAEGMVLHATFSLRGRPFMCIDSPVPHDWTFTPAISLYVPCESDEEIERLYRELSAGGQVYMELGSYPFSQKFAWVGDRFGVTWQLSLGL